MEYQVWKASSFGFTNRCMFFYSYLCILMYITKKNNRKSKCAKYSFKISLSKKKKKNDLFKDSINNSTENPRAKIVGVVHKSSSFINLLFNSLHNMQDPVVQPDLEQLQRPVSLALPFPVPPPGLSSSASVFCFFFFSPLVLILSCEVKQNCSLVLSSWQSFAYLKSVTKHFF